MARSLSRWSRIATASKRPRKFQARVHYRLTERWQREQFEGKEARERPDGENREEQFADPKGQEAVSRLVDKRERLVAEEVWTSGDEEVKKRAPGYELQRYAVAKKRVPTERIIPPDPSSSGVEVLFPARDTSALDPFVLDKSPNTRTGGCDGMAGQALTDSLIFFPQFSR
jgi:hypothetical protein